MVDPDSRVFQRLSKLQKSCIPINSGNQDELDRIACQETAEWITEIFNVVLDGRNNDSNIIVCETGMFGFGD